MTGRQVVSGLAVATSRRPGALSILEAKGAMTAANAPRYWADPTSLATATTLLSEAKGFCVTRTSRLGVHFTAFAADVEALFGVTLTATGDAMAPAWQIKDATGASVAVIAPMTDAQKACLRGIRLTAPVRTSAAPLNNVPALEAMHLDRAAYQVMPHQLRTQLSETLRPSWQVDEIPRGAGVQVNLFDSGWRHGNHPYWAATNLDQAARRVRLVQDNAGFQAANVRARRTLRDLVADLRETLDDPLFRRPVGTESVGMGVSAFYAQVMRGLEARRATFTTLDGYFPTAEVMIAFNTLRFRNEKSFRNYAGILRMIDVLKEDVRQIISVVNSAMLGMQHSVPDEVVTGPDGQMSHGTAVVSQVIAVAPEAEIVMYQSPDGVSANQLYGALFREASPYRGKDYMDWVSDLLQQPIAPATAGRNGSHSRVVSVSQSSDYDFGPGTPQQAVQAALAVEQFDNLAYDMAMEGIWATFSAGNGPPKNPDPNGPELQKVPVQTRTEEHNILVVGSAAWASRNSRDVLRPARHTGYKHGTIVTPFVCGLSGKFDGKGVSILPIFDANQAATYGAAQGTSFTTPQVAGVMAIVLGIVGLPHLLEIRTILKAAQTELDTDQGDFWVPQWATSVMGLTPEEGRPGLVDLWAAYQAATDLVAEDLVQSQTPLPPVPTGDQAAPLPPPLPPLPTTLPGDTGQTTLPPLPIVPGQPLVPSRPPPPPPRNVFIDDGEEFARVAP